MYQFDFIEDTRNCETPEKTMAEHHETLLKRLSGLDIIITWTGIRELVFGEPEPCVSFRRTYYISKNTRKITWNTVLGVINSVQAPYYKHI